MSARFCAALSKRNACTGGAGRGAEEALELVPAELVVGGVGRDVLGVGPGRRVVQDKVRGAPLGAEPARDVVGREREAERRARVPQAGGEGEAGDGDGERPQPRRLGPPQRAAAWRRASTAEAPSQPASSASS